MEQICRKVNRKSTINWWTRWSNMKIWNLIVGAHREDATKQTLWLLCVFGHRQTCHCQPVEIICFVLHILAVPKFKTNHHHSFPKKCSPPEWRTARWNSQYLDIQIYSKISKHFYHQSGGQRGGALSISRAADDVLVEILGRRGSGAQAPLF